MKPQVHQLEISLRRAGLRPTRQRLQLATILFAQGDRHVSADLLYREARAAHMNVSLATVYNTLRQFTEAGLLRQIAIEGACAFYDTNTSSHYHYYLRDTGQLIDIDTNNLEVAGLPELPPGMESTRVDVIIRLRPARLAE
jgi:Fur family transcriptional regulator, iron response regulator